MKDSLDFLCLFSRITKAFKQEGLEISSSAGSQDGITCHLEFEGKQYGLYIVNTEILYDALKEHMCAKPDSESCN